MSSQKGTNSIVLLAFRLLPHVRPSAWNFFIPIVGAILFATVFYGESNLSYQICKDILEAILQFDGAVLGLILAVFGIYGTVESNQRTLFAITRAPQNSNFSYYKLKLVTVFKMCFWVFSCSAFLLIVYALLLAREQVPLISEFLSEKSRYSFLAFIIAWTQIKILVELKIYVFSMYQRALTEARSYAIEQGKQPFDSSID